MTPQNRDKLPALSSTPDKTPASGEIVIFRKRQEPSCGVFLSSSAGKLTVVSEEGKQLSFPEEKVAFLTGIKVKDGLSPREMTMEMRKLRKNLEEARGDFDLKPLWLELSGQGAVSFEYAARCFPRALSPEETLKLFWAVDKDAVYFRRQSGGYVPLPPEDVEKTLARLKRHAEKEQQQRLAVRWIKSVQDGDPAEPDGFDRAACVAALMAYIENAEHLPAFKDARVILTKTGLSDPALTVRFLIETGDLPEGSDPAIIKAGIDKGFSSEAMEQAARLLSGDVNFGDLEDLTGLEAFSVDDETTEDIDDAISVELTGAGARVGVHIANVALCIKPESPLDRAAMETAETVYLPERRADIFPLELIKGRLSLAGGGPRAALSLLMDFDEEAREVKSFRFVSSKIVVRKNLSYAEADAMIESSPEWGRLAQICANLKEAREKRGAFSVQIPGLVIKADAKGGLKVAHEDEPGAAHGIVSEMMITANTICASFLKDRGIPAIFRLQLSKVSPEARALDRADPLFPARVGRLMKPSKIDTAPGAHRALGVDCYAQATSPIRRYRDLVVQRQILAEITGNPALGEQAVLDLITRTDEPIARRRTAQRSRRRFWLLEHFRRLGPDVRFRAIVSRIWDGRVFAYLPDYLTEFSIGVDTGNLKEGQEVTLAVRHLDPVRRKLKLKAV